MKQKFSPNAPLAAAVVAAMIVGMLFLSYFLSSGFYSAKDGPPPLSAPTTEADETGETGELYGVEGIEITPQNVQQVIEALARAGSYSQTVNSTLYYDGQSSTQVVAQYVRGDICRTDVMRGGSAAESWLRAGDDIYAWQPGGSGYFHGAAGDFSDDSMAMLPDWQTVTALPLEAVVSAATVISGGEPILLVTANSGERRAEYEISTISGLLHAARIYEGDTLIREIRVTGISMEEPDDFRFVLPDGTSLLPVDETP